MNLKKRILAFVLVAVMVLNWVPVSAARSVTKADMSQSSGGKLGLTSPSGIKQDTGFANKYEGLTKYEQSSLEPFSAIAKDFVYEEDELVTFVVSLDETPLLVSFDAEQIGQQTEAVRQQTEVLEAAIAVVQARVQEAFGETEGFEMGFAYTMATVGFSVTTTFGNLEALKAIEGVQSAYVAPVFDVPVSSEESLNALTSNSSNMIGADIANKTGYTGRGMRIAILDTGIAVDHPSFAALPDEALVDPMTRDSVDKIWSELNAGKMSAKFNLSYYNSKIPFIFNYTSGDFNVANSFAGSDHGTHVAGIAAANRVEGVDVVGMAPDAQLVVMQVFQQGGGAAWPTIMAALEDCILLEVDTVNLSLGSAAGFYDPEGQMLDTLTLFLETDIQVLIASGNDTNNAYMNLWGGDMSLIFNPDIGLAGTPSTYSTALAVGSVDNDGYEMYYITVGGVDYGFMDNATSETTNFLANFRDSELEYVVVPGVGAPEDYEGLDVTGKVALVSRGEIAFTEKQAYAAEMGAIAVIVYNNDRGPFGMVITEGGIPAVSIDREAGAALIAAAGEDGVGTLKVCNADSKVFKIPQTISSFSSWGVTPDLKLKPEISGVGGSIYATRDPELTGAYYGYMSGTSMATPQIAGAMAVLIQYLDENYPEITGAQQRIMAANILMSTANPVMYNDLYEYSPRAQGAGLADLVKATTTAAYLSVPTASESRPKVEFGDDPERTGVYTFSFTITNISDETVSYTFDSSVLTEQIYSGWFIANAPYGLEAKVSVPELVEVPAGETVTVEAQLVLTDNDKAYLDYFPNGIYVEGYLYANPTNEDGVTLAMPMVGFYGDWSDAPVFDNDTMSGMYLGSYSLYPRVVYTYYGELGTNPYFRNGASGEEYSYISYKNLIDEIDFGMLRNAKYMYISVVDAVTGELYYEIAGADLAKTYFNANYGMIIPFYLLSSYGEVWDGTDAEGNYLPDGTIVTYRFDAWLDDGDEEMDDTWSFNVRIDDTNPELLNDNDLQNAMRVDGDRTYLTLEMLENEKIAAVIFISPNGTIMGKYEVENLPGEVLSQEFDITGFGSEFTIVVADYACNETEVDVYLNLGEQNNAVPEPQKLDNGRLYGSETFDSALVEGGWFSADKYTFADPRNETYDTAARYYSAEYVNGYIIGQNVNTGHLELITPSGTYWSTKVICENQGAVGQSGVWVLYDMALDHSGTLAAAYGVSGGFGSDALFATGWLYQGDNDNDGRDDGYNALFHIKFDPYGYVTVQPIARLMGAGYGADILTLGITTEGQIYGIDTNAILYSIGTTTEWDSSIGQWGDYVINCTEIGVTDFVYYTNYYGANVIQSMGYDHNTGIMYWYAHSQYPSGYYYENLNVTFAVDLETGHCYEVGTYGPGGQTSLFVPNDLESDLFTMGVEATGMEIAPYSLTLVEGQTGRLKINWRPWNAAPGEVTWASSDETIATVDEYGFVTALQPGEITISASTEMMLEGYWDVTPEGEWVWVEPAMGTKTVNCSVRIVDSQDELYGFVLEDTVNSKNSFSWVTFADSAPTDVTVLAGSDYMWMGGTYYNGYVYTVAQDSFEQDGVIYSGTSLFRHKVTKGNTAAETVIGEPEFVGFQDGMLISAMSFDYNTGRMYCVENQNIGGLGIIDLDTGKVDMLGWPNGDLYGGVYMTALCVTRTGTVLVADAVGSIYTIDPDTLTTRMLVQGNGSPYTAFFEAMFYDYNNDVIYYNMCDGSSSSPLYMILLEDYGGGYMNATMINLGGVSNKGGVQQTVMFTIPDEEPETQHIPVESIDITNGDKIIGLEGGQLKLDVVTNPARPTLQKKTWTSSDESVVTVDEYGTLTYVGVGTATITVTITNKDEATHGGPFTDSVVVEVVEAAGEFVAFINSDENATGYFDFWLKGNDFDLRHMIPTQSVISIYSLRAGTYYDGYFYGYTDKGQFIRIDADNLTNYKVLGNANLDYTKYQVTAMAMDYTTGIMYGLTLTSNVDYNTWASEEHVGQLVTIDLDTGLMTTVADLDFNTPVFALSCDKNGQLYAAGGSMDMYATSTTIYKMDKATAELTEYVTIDGAGVFTDSNYYGSVRYNTQLTYDFGTDRLYMNATVNSLYNSRSFGVFMIQLGEAPAVANLGGISLWTRGDYDSVKHGDVYLGLMTFIPDADELPVGKVNGIILNKNTGRVGVGETTQLVAQVRPSNAADPSVTWASSDSTVAVVDENGVVTGVSEGNAIITVTSNETGVTATCLITVAQVSGPQNMAYTVSASRSAIYAFNPAMPAQTAKVIAKLDAGGTIRGLAYGDNCLYFVAYIDYGVYIYKYDFATNSNSLMGQVNCFFEPSGLAYDAENELFYITGGFYLFQYDAANMTTEYTNDLLQYVMDSDYCTLTGVAVVDGAVYTFGNEYYNSIPQMMKYSDMYLNDRSVVLTNLEVPLVSYATDVSYDAGSGLFYFADPGHTLYAMDMEGNTATVDILGDGIDLNGLAIDPTAKFQITYTDGVDGTELFRDQFYFAAEGDATPMFIGTPSRAGYTFAGWTPVVDETVTGHVVYEATWTPNTYKLTFDVSGGDLENRSMEVTFGQPIGQMPVPERTGYTFVGWIDREGNMFDADTIYNVDGNTFLIAVWKANTYTLFLDANGGMIEPTEVIVTFDSVIGELPEPVRPGYTFVGWIDEDGNKVLGSAIYERVGDCKLTAQWSANAYTIYLDANGGDLSVKGIIVEFGGAVNTLPVPTMVGHIFVGWFDAEGNQYTAETIYNVAGDITLYAQWTEDMGPPPTGDTAPIGFLLMMAAMTAVGMVALVVKRKETF